MMYGMVGEVANIARRKMSNRLLSVIFFMMVASLTSGVSFANDGDSKFSDAEIKKMIISDSISSYPGNCPCPYNSAKNGSRCGGRSAWSRAGGYSPICYESDVTEDMINKWRALH